MKKRYYRPRNPKSGKPKAKANRLPIQPGVDKALKETFSQIGIPEKAPFTPDPFQLEALEAINASDCLVAAPTGAGKTWIAEQAAKTVLDRGERPGTPPPSRP